MVKRFLARRLIFFFGLIFFISCGISYDVQVYDNGSAQIRQFYSGNPTEKDMKIYIESDIISDFDTVAVPSAPSYIEMNFLTETVDSLGKYLTFFKPEFVDFDKVGNVFTISLPGGEPFKHDTHFRTYMRVGFDHEISEIISDQIKVKKDGSSAVILNKSNKRLKNKGRPIEIKIILKQS